MLEEALAAASQPLAMPVVVTELTTAAGPKASAADVAAAYGVEGATLPPRTPPPPQLAGAAGAPATAVTCVASSIWPLLP